MASESSMSLRGTTSEPTTSLDPAKDTRTYEHLHVTCSDLVSGDVRTVTTTMLKILVYNLYCLIKL